MVNRAVASRAAIAPPATTNAMGNAELSPPRASSGETGIPPPNMHAPSTAEAAPAAGARSTPSTVALAEDHSSSQELCLCDPGWVGRYGNGGGG